MSNRPYEIDMPSLTRLKAMEDEAIGFTSSAIPETPKAVQGQDTNGRQNAIAEPESAAQQDQRRRRMIDESDEQHREGRHDSRETAGMDVHVRTEDQASHSHEMISQCEGHWLFANAVLGQGKVSPKAKGKGKEVEPLARSGMSAPDVAESMHSKAKVDDLCSSGVQQTQPNDTMEGQEYPIPKDDLLIMLEVGFAERPYWTTADLADALQQPETYLNEVLPHIALFGPWLGGYPQRWCWRLKPAEEKSEGRWKGKERVEFWE